jgi:hypothetical protein
MNLGEMARHYSLPYLHPTIKYVLKELPLSGAAFFHSMRINAIWHVVYKRESHLLGEPGDLSLGGLANMVPWR